MKTLLLLFTLTLSIIARAQVCLPNTSSLKFNGNSDYVQINSSTNLELDSSVTVEAWIKPTQFGFNYWDNSIFCKHSWTTGEQGFVLRCGANGNLSFNFAGYANGAPTSWKDIYSPDSSLQLDVWQHVAGSYDGYRMRLYVNGMQVADSIFAGSMVAGVDYNPAIGRLCDLGQFGSRYFKGKIDEVRVWNRALSDAELQQKMSVHLDPATETGLVGYWRLNDSTGSDVTDWSMSGNTGDKNGAAWQLEDVPFDNAAAIPTVTQSGDLLISSAAAAYQWYHDFVEISGATNQMYLAELSGYYNVQITDSIGCMAMSDTLSIIPTQVEEAGPELFQLLGNPVNEVLNIVLDPKSAYSTFTLLNTAGTTVLEVKIPAGQPLLSVPVDQLPQGLYIAIARSMNTVRSARFAMQR